MNKKEIHRTLIAIIISIPIILWMWNSIGWASIFAGFILGGIIFVIIEEFFNLIKQEKTKLQTQESNNIKSIKQYEEDLKVIQNYSDVILSFGEKNSVPTENELNNSLNRINLAFKRIIDSDNFNNSEMKNEIIGLKNSFYLTYSGELKEFYLEN